MSYGLLPLEVDVLRGAEVPRERDAVEQFADLALVHRHVIKQGQQEREQNHDEDHADPDQPDLSTTVVMSERDERHQRVCGKETEDEAEQVGVVVDPWQDAQNKQAQQGDDQFGQSSSRVLQHRPAVQNLDDQRCKQGEVRSCWSDL